MDKGALTDNSSCPVTIEEPVPKYDPLAKMKYSLGLVAMYIRTIASFY